jgi:hypothetical protein
MSRPFVRATVLLQVMLRSRFAQTLTRSEGAGEVHMVKATVPSDFAEGELRSIVISFATLHTASSIAVRYPGFFLAPVDA